MQQTLTTIAIWLLTTALLNLVAHRSQVDSWCERRPKLAAVLKLFRGVGLDPWLLIQGLTLAFRSRLPLGLRPEPVDVPVEVDATIPTPSTMRSGTLLLLPLLLLGCGPRPDACAPESDLAAIEARYVAETMQACRDYETAAACPGQTERSERFRAERKAWALCQTRTP
jgi:hypothetical protein